MLIPPLLFYCGCTLNLLGSIAVAMGRSWGRVQLCELWIYSDYDIRLCRRCYFCVLRYGYGKMRVNLPFGRVGVMLYTE